MTREELLMKAIRDYPIGTEFNSAYNRERKGIVKASLVYKVHDDSVAIFTTGRCDEAVYYKYKDGIGIPSHCDNGWATITNKVEQEELYQIY